MAGVTAFLKSLGASLGIGFDLPSGADHMGGVAFDIPVAVAAAADGGAASNTANTKIFVNPLKCYVRVKMIGVNVDANIAANNTDFATYAFLADDGAGGTKTSFATHNTSGAAQGALTAGVTKEFTISNSTAALLAPGACLYRSVTKTANGVAVGAHNVVVRFRRASSTE